MGLKSRNKGKRGERAFAKHLRALGFEARRGVQHAGGPESPDVVTSLDGLHFEVKFGYSKSKFDLGTLALEMALEQADREKPPRTCPVVAWKPIGCLRWRYTMYSDHPPGLGLRVWTACLVDDEEERYFLESLCPRH